MVVVVVVVVVVAVVVVMVLLAVVLVVVLVVVLGCWRVETCQVSFCVASGSLSLQHKTEHVQKRDWVSSGRRTALVFSVNGLVRL